MQTSYANAYLTNTQGPNNIVNIRIPMKINKGIDFLFFLITATINRNIIIQKYNDGDSNIFNPITYK